MKRNAVLLIAVMFVTGFALAHQGMHHVMGTVTKISESSITVETKEKTSAAVSFGPETKFVKNRAVATIKDLKVGDRVVIHAHGTDKALQADTVQIGVSKH